jgi:glycosyltransferase involved in cell wall biosynthesis
MKILIQPAHTSCEFELAKLGHDFYSIAPTWDGKQRPKPENWHLKIPRGSDFDLAIIGTAPGWDIVRKKGFPVIYCEHCNIGGGPFHERIEDGVGAVVFVAEETSGRYLMKDDSKRVVIENPVDPNVWGPYIGSGVELLTVGNLIPKRREMNPQLLVEVSRHYGLEIVGDINGDMPGASGPAGSMENLRKKYQNAKIYFNTCAEVGLAFLEAMATGMPVVTVAPTKYKDFVEHDLNCFVFEGLGEGMNYIRKLLGDPPLRKRMGAVARKMVSRRFHTRIFQAKWDALLTSVLREHK